MRFFNKQLIEEIGHHDTILYKLECCGIVKLTVYENQSWTGDGKSNWSADLKLPIHHGKDISINIHSKGGPEQALEEIEVELLKIKRRIERLEHDDILMEQVKLQ